MGEPVLLKAQGVAANTKTTSDFYHLTQENLCNCSLSKPLANPAFENGGRFAAAVSTTWGEINKFILSVDLRNQAKLAFPLSVAKPH
jgi:hypothetical protein